MRRHKYLTNLNAQTPNCASDLISIFWHFVSERCVNILRVKEYLTLYLTNHVSLKCLRGYIPLGTSAHDVYSIYVTLSRPFRGPVPQRSTRQLRISRPNITKR